MNGEPFAVSRALFDVEHRFLDLDGTRIHYVDEGQGETLLVGDWRAPIWMGLNTHCRNR